MQNKFLKFGLGFIAIVILVILFTPVKVVPYSTISVSGECAINIPKDKSSITLRVRTLDANAGTSLSKMNERLAYWTRVASEFNDISIQTTEIYAYEKTEWNQSENRQIKLGYETTGAVEIISSDQSQITRIMSLISESDDTVLVENLRMFASPESIKNATEDCLAAAFENAKKRGELLASEMNKKLGDAISIKYNDGSSTEIPIRPLARAMVITKDMGAGSIASNDQAVGTSVNVVFNVK